MKYVFAALIGAALGGAFLFWVDHTKDNAAASNQAEEYAAVQPRTPKPEVLTALPAEQHVPPESRQP